MITDNAILLATEEAVPNGAATPGGLGGNTITGVAATPFVIDMLQQANPLGYGIDDLGNGELELCVSVTTAFTTTTPASTLEFQLVSMPILPTLLTSATTSGRLLSLASVATADTGDTFTITGHGLALGTPLYLSVLTTTTGPSINTLYYAVPLSADTFGIATTLANALAGTIVALTNDGSATVVFMPLLHATTGPIQTVFMKAGARFFGRGWSQAGVVGGKRVAPYAGATPKPLGVGVMPGTGTGGGTTTFTYKAPGRYLALNVVAAGANSDTTGRYSVRLGINTQNKLGYYPTALEVR